MNQHELELNIDGTIFTFPEDFKVSPFDTWKQYQRLTPLGISGCDIVAYARKTLWIIEVKDYTYPGSSVPGDLPELIALKAHGTMGVLYALQRTKAQSEAQEFAVACAEGREIRVVLHIEVKDGGRKGKHIMGPLMALQQKLKKRCDPLGLSKCHVTSTFAPSVTHWKTRRDPATRGRHSDR